MEFTLPPETFFSVKFPALTLKPLSADVVSATEDKENATTTSVKTPQPKTPDLERRRPDARRQRVKRTLRQQQQFNRFPPLLYDQVTLQVRKTIQKYYAQKLRSDDELYVRNQRHHVESGGRRRSRHETVEYHLLWRHEKSFERIVHAARPFQTFVEQKRRVG